MRAALSHAAVHVATSSATTTTATTAATTAASAETSASWGVLKASRVNAEVRLPHLTPVTQVTCAYKIIPQSCDNHPKQHPKTIHTRIIRLTWHSHPIIRCHNQKHIRIHTRNISIPFYDESKKNIPRSSNIHIYYIIIHAHTHPVPNWPPTGPQQTV